MVEVAGRTLLAHQLVALEAAGIVETHLVLGHGADRVRSHPDAAGLGSWVNREFATTNMVATLLCAENPLDGTSDLVIAYGDIVYEPRLVTALFEVDAEVVVVVDLGWRDYWMARMEDPLADAETLRFADGGRLLEIGAQPQTYDDIEAQYVGLVRVRADAIPRFRAEAQQLTAEDPRAYMTTLLQRLIDAGRDVRVAPVINGWLEIDRPADLAIDISRFWAPSAQHAE
jgi:choline kinase